MISSESKVGVPQDASSKRRAAATAQGPRGALQFGQELRLLLGAELRSAGRGLEPLVLALLVASAVVASTALLGRGIAPSARGSAALFLAVVFAGTQAAGESFGQAIREGSLQALLLGPTRPVTLYLAKGARVLLITWGAGVAAVLGLLLVLPDLGWLGELPRLLGLVLAVGLGVTALTSLVGPLLGGQAGRESLLALVLLPVLVPLVVLGARGVRALLVSRPEPGLYWESLGLVAGLDLLFLVCALWLFEPLVRAQR